ncbi:MAG: MBL fold metallo-hydrolase [Gammaproteobacteria bacterium]|jgi:alkyl sulfatase BDS1-like metallo-beta-lactamase superfamily hydrolase|nr:MBL fold metallo-hydrolase [Gammaproteobacteria bacterium]
MKNNLGILLLHIFITSILSSPIYSQSIPPVTPKIHPELKKHSERFVKKVYKIADNVYSAVGWNVAGIVMIEGDDGIILVDAGLSPESSREVMNEFRKITDKPIVAVIYSHFHHDHIVGVKGLISQQQVDTGEVAIYAHSSLMRLLVDESQILGPILGVRAGYTFGFFLKGADIKDMNSGHGPLARGGPGSFIAPTHIVDDLLRVTIAGVELEIMHIPSEADDELVVYLPKTRVLIDTEVIQGPTFPNMHTLRGTKFRDPVQWIRSIDQLRRLHALHLVPTHGQPVSGGEKVEEVLRMTRDGIQYVHDQTVRYINKGLTPDELVEEVKLPPHLFNYTPYLRQYYGTVKQAVRQIYVGYLGWYEGDPVALNPIPAKEKSRRLIKLMGGRDSVAKAAMTAYGKSDYQWAAELATLLIRINNKDSQAKEIKAASFRQLGYANMNINWRNWYLTSALELEGKLASALDSKKMANIFTPPDIVTEMPAAVSIKGWTTRLKAEDTLTVSMSLGFIFTDLKQQFALSIRRGVCQFDESLPVDANLLLSLNKTIFDQIQLGNTDFMTAIEKGDIKLKGKRAELKRFLGYFEEVGTSPISLTVH